LARHVSLDAVKRGDVDLLDILKLNALMDAQEAAQAAAQRKMG
jgi:DNA-binding protein YbaB